MNSTIASNLLPLSRKMLQNLVESLISRSKHWKSLIHLITYLHSLQTRRRRQRWWWWKTDKERNEEQTENAYRASLLYAIQSLNLTTPQSRKSGSRCLQLSELC